MSRLDFLLDNLTAALERRRRLEDIEMDRHDDLALIEESGRSKDAYELCLSAYYDAQCNRAHADQSVLSIAADIADHVRDRKAKLNRAIDGGSHE